MYIAILVLWLSATGNIDAQANGVADSVEHCKQIAAQAITAEGLKPDSPVKSDKVITLCYDTRTDAAKYAPTKPDAPVVPLKKPGTVDL
jgi:hypothetical protein